MQLTDQAQQIIGHYLGPGQYAVDATAGNGHDSCFLAGQIGDKGKVFIFDIQKQALDNTAARLQEQGLTAQAELILRGHEHLQEELPGPCHGQIQAVMFNLGYLPSGDKSRTTTSATTLPALEQARAILSPEGVITVLAYRGHPGGQEEAAAAEHKLKALAGDGLQFSAIESPGPVLLVLAPARHD
ncbi:class I SAM-dependent methyltransferase [Thiolapillus sp.]